MRAPPSAPRTSILDNLGSVDHQLRQLQHSDSPAENENSSDTRIAALENSSLKNVWQTVRSQLNFESGVFRHATRLSILVAASCIIVEILHLNLGYWILLTAVFVCQPNYTATKSRVYQRIAGTILGVIVGSLVPYFTPSVETKLWIVIASTTLLGRVSSTSAGIISNIILCSCIISILLGEEEANIIFVFISTSLSSSALKKGGIFYGFLDS